ncbi:MAG: NAD(+) diphosphatase [Devosia sp.]|uniref:NAD(+) diphosphatase n=1 Tax=Devosia sp. TaxID=1871048 RepID=UPI003399D8DB
MTSRFAFTSGSLERAAHLRTSEDSYRDDRSQTLIFWRGKVLVDQDGIPLFAPLDHSALKDCRDRPLFLGITENGPRFASDLTLWAPPEDAATIGQFVDQSLQVHPDWPAAKFSEVRTIMSALSALDGECVATGKALLAWHSSHRFCANCGNPSTVEHSGWVRKCPQCGTQHFPRTDPVVIMAISRGDELLLGRAPSWPEKMYSLLAGFVEPGETIEAAVRREVLEESRIEVGKVQYVTGQPWPFPMSLMFGCYGEAKSDAITIDPVELADARWVRRDEVLAILDGNHPDISCPRAGTIAGALIAAWAKGELFDEQHWAR